MRPEEIEKRIQEGKDLNNKMALGLSLSINPIGANSVRQNFICVTYDEALYIAARLRDFEEAVLAVYVTKKDCNDGWYKRHEAANARIVELAAMVKKRGRKTMELNPKHPVTNEMRDLWYKVSALLMYKFGQTSVEITKADMDALNEIWLVDDTTALKLSEEK